MVKGKTHDDKLSDANRALAGVVDCRGESKIVEIARFPGEQRKASFQWRQEHESSKLY